MSLQEKHRMYTIRQNTSITAKEKYQRREKAYFRKRRTLEWMVQVASTGPSTTIASISGMQLEIAGWTVM
jgi:hypothetical protein